MRKVRVVFVALSVMPSPAAFAQSLSLSLLRLGAGRLPGAAGGSDWIGDAAGRLGVVDISCFVAINLT